MDNAINILCDGGYTSPSFVQSIKETIDCSVEIIKRSEFHQFVVLPQRWIVERTLENSRQSYLLAGVAILLKRF
nr:hypothetical protein [Bacillus cereus]